MVSVLYHAHPCMKCSLDISSFIKEISSLPFCCFLYFFALFIEEGLLTSPWYSLELCILLGISFPFSLAFHFVLFSTICKASSDNHFAFLHFFFFGMVLVTTSWTMFLYLFVYCNGECSLLPPFYFIHFLFINMYS